MDKICRVITILCIIEIVSVLNTDHAVGKERIVADYSEIKLIDNNVLPYIKAADALFKEKKYDDAIDIYIKAIRIYPNNSELYSLLGKTYRTKADSFKNYRISAFMPDADNNEYNKLYEKAIEAQEIAIQLDNNNHVALYERGEIYYNIAYDVNMHIDISNTNNSAIDSDYYKIKLDYYKLAIDFFNKAIAVAPKEEIYYLSRATCYEKVSEYDKAFSDYNNVIELNPKFHLAYFNRGHLNNKLQKHNEAIRDYTKAISLEPSISIYYDSRASVFEQINKYDQAINDYTKSIYTYPNNPFTYFNRGNIYLKVKQGQKAIKDFKEACNLGWNDACSKTKELLKDEARGEKWVFYAETSGAKYYYNSKNLKNNKKHVKVWVQIEYIDASEKVNSRQKYGLESNGYEYLSHTIESVDISCGNATFRPLNSVDYDLNGSVLDSAEYSTESYAQIIPDSVMAELYDKVCREKKLSKTRNKR